MAWRRSNPKSANCHAKFHEPGERRPKKQLGRPCRYQQAVGTTSSRHLGTSFYTIVRSTMQHLVRQGTRERESDIRQF